MTAARISPSQARKLGIDTPATKTRTTRKVVPSRGTFHSRCKKCGEEFHTTASEDRHVHDTHHARYECVL